MRRDLEGVSSLYGIELTQWVGFFDIKNRLTSGRSVLYRFVQKSRIDNVNPLPALFLCVAAISDKTVNRVRNICFSPNVSIVMKKERKFVRSTSKLDGGM